MIRASQVLNQLRTFHRTVVCLPTEIKNHRLGAYIYGFLSGVGLLMIIWGLASVAILPSAYLMTNVGLILFGVALFAGGACREAFLRGNLSIAERAYPRAAVDDAETAEVVAEQIVECPREVET